MLDLAVPIRLFIGDAARFDIRPGLLVAFDPETVASLKVALGFAVSFTRNLYLDLQASFVVPDFTFDASYVPFRAELGWALEGNGGAAFIDAFVFAEFPFFLNLSSVGDTLNATPWQIGIGARGHFGLN